VAIAHKGFAWFEIVTRGRAAHGSRPSDGRDAIMRMGRVLGALERLDRDLQARQASGLEGTGSLHASTINGGRELSSYPDECTLQMERRTVAGENAETTTREIDAILRRLKRDDPEFEAVARLTTHREPYRLPAAHPLVVTLGAVLGESGRLDAPIGMSFWTDAAILGEAGIPTAIFGPGGAGLHGPNEYVIVEDVLTCRDVLVETVRRLVDSLGQPVSPSPSQPFP
jgi:acetylornithine deacetylase